MVKVDLNVWSLVGATEKLLKVWVWKSVVVLEAELKRLTPEDTKEMLNSYISDIDSDWSSVIWEVGNTAKHAIYVEYWVEWKKYNYHKPKGSVFYNWVWNRTFARAVDNKKWDILDIINRAIWGQ